jgi:hypothetical protein
LNWIFGRGEIGPDLQARVQLTQESSEVMIPSTAVAIDRFLDSQEATAELVLALTGGQDVDSHSNYVGVLGSPYRKQVLPLMEQRLIAADQPVWERYLDALAELAELVASGGPMGPYPGDAQGQNAWQAEQKRRADLQWISRRRTLLKDLVPRTTTAWARAILPVLRDLVVNPCYDIGFQFHQLGPWAYSPALERLAIESLTSPKVPVKRGAAEVLGKFGSADAQKPLWETMEYFRSWWKGRESELNEKIGEEGTQLERALRIALARSDTWILQAPTYTAVGPLQQRVVSDRSERVDRVCKDSR